MNIRIMLTILMASAPSFGANQSLGAPDFGWKEIGPGAFGWMHGVAISPHDPRTIIAGIDMGSVYRTLDRARHWEKVGRGGSFPPGLPGYRGMNCCTFDPKDPNIVWVGSTHGIYESADRGETWALKLGGDPGASIGAIAVDPGDSQIVYAANGTHADRGESWLDGHVWKTTDGGKRWQELARPGGLVGTDPSRHRNWHALVIDPKSSFLPGKGHKRLYLAGPGGFFISEDAGDSWQSLAASMPDGDANLQKGTRATTFPLSAACDVVLVPGEDPTRSAILATFRFRYEDSSHRHLLGGVFRSDDGGARWTRMNEGLEGDLRARIDKGEKTYLLISACASHPDRVYIAGFRNVWESKDGGKSWSLVTHPNLDWIALKDFDGKPVFWSLPTFSGNFVKGAPYGIISLATSPTDPDEVAFTDAGGVTLSVDGGQTWDETFYDYGAPYRAGAVGNRPPNRATHLERSRGAQLIVAQDLAVDPFDPKTIAIAYDDTGLQISRDGGEWWEWAWYGVLGDERSNASAVLYDPLVKNRMFLGCDNRTGKEHHVYESDDGGRSFHIIGLSALSATAYRGKDTALTAFVTVPRSKSVTALYAATSIGVFEAELPSESSSSPEWRDVSGPMAGKCIHRLVGGVGKPDSLLAGLADPRDASVGGLYRSDDGGENWRQLGADHLGRIQTISFCTAKPEVIVVTAGAPAARGNPESHPCTTWRTDDGGATWRQIDRRRAALAAVNPRDPKIVYLGTWGWDVTREPVGFWISSDDGTTWSDANRGLAISLGGAVDQLRFDVNNLRRLFLIHESGVYLGSDPS